MDHQEVGWAGVNWIDVVQYMNRWQALVNAVMNIRAPKNAGIFLLAEDLLASQEGLYLMESLVICIPREVSRYAVGKETVGRCVYTSVFFSKILRLTQDKYNWYFGHFKFDIATVMHWELAIWRCACKALVLFHTTPCLAAPMLLTLEDLRAILLFYKHIKHNTNS
jgi:hypothetical protein